MKGKLGGSREATSDVEDLAFMLKTLLGHDCDGLAERLIERFGSFTGVFRATRRELMEVRGITERTALFFASARPAFRRALSRSGTGIVDTEAALAAEALSLFPDLETPHTYCIFTDGAGNVIAEERIDNAHIQREVVGNAARSAAKCVAVVGCRPTLKPDYAGICRTAEKLARALELIGAPLVDYTEYRDFKIFSLRRAVLGSPLRFDIEDAKHDKLTPIDGFADKIASFIAQRPNFC